MKLRQQKPPGTQFFHVHPSKNLWRNVLSSRRDAYEEVEDGFLTCNSRSLPSKFGSCTQYHPSRDVQGFLRFQVIEKAVVKIETTMDRDMSFMQDHSECVRHRKIQAAVAIFRPNSNIGKTEMWITCGKSKWQYTDYSIVRSITVSSNILGESNTRFSMHWDCSIFLLKDSCPHVSNFVQNEPLHLRVLTIMRQRIAHNPNQVTSGLWEALQVTILDKDASRMWIVR